MTTLEGKERCSRVAVLQHPAVVVGGAMIAVQMLIRGWALYSSFFYTDDYRLLWDAHGQKLSGSYLVEPFDSQFMPFGRLLAWTVAENGHMNWALAASLTLLIQLLASVACLYMLMVLFGPRWGILPPLGIYLSSVVTLPAFMWWAAALNQLPWQLVFFLAVSAWIQYLRSCSRWWLALVTLVILFGLMSYIKTLLILPVLAVLMLGWFSSGSALERIRDCLRHYWPAAVAMTVVAGAFSIFYSLFVPQVFSDSTAMEYNPYSIAGDLADSMLASSLVTGVVGGPWRWISDNPPIGYADPPAWFVGLSWVAVAGTAATLFLLRKRTGRVLLLVTSYSLIAYFLVLTSRARVAGAYIGTDLRYLTDVLPVVALSIGLASMRLLGSRESSQPRAHPLLTLQVGPWLVPMLTMVVVSSGLWSTVTYVQRWHHDNPGADYVRTIRSDLPAGRRLDMAAQVVPANVIPGFSFPYNSTRRFLTLISPNFRFPDSTDQLHVLDENGGLHRALIQTGVSSGEGPERDCGWRVLGQKVRSIPLTSEIYDYDWWVRINYLSSSNSPITVEAGRTTIDTNIHAGVGSLYVQMSGSMDQVRISGLEGESALCIDTVEVGTPIPGPRL